MAVCELDALFLKTLEDDYDDDEPWKAVHTLRKLGTPEVFDRAVEWCRSSNDSQRARGVDILAQLGGGGDAETIESFQMRALPIILELLEKEKAALPVASAISALGHLSLPAAIPLIVSYTKHFDPDVRYAVAFALGSFADDQRSIEALLTLMKDDDHEIRHWATFSLCSLGNADNKEVRAALTDALNDDDEDVWLEAAIGLGRRRDRQAAEPLEAILSDDPSTAPAREAAKLLLGFEETSDVELEKLLSALRNMQAWGKTR